MWIIDRHSLCSCSFDTGLLFCRLWLFIFIISRSHPLPPPPATTTTHHRQHHRQHHPPLAALCRPDARARQATHRGGRVAAPSHGARRNFNRRCARRHRGARVAVGRATGTSPPLTKKKNLECLFHLSSHRHVISALLFDVSHCFISFSWLLH